MINQVPNLNHYPINPNDDRFFGFGFLPFLGGLAVGGLAGGAFSGGFGGGRPCCGPTPMPMPMPAPTQPQFVPMPIPQPVFVGQPQIQPTPSYSTVQGPLLESNKFFIR